MAGRFLATGPQVRHPCPGLLLLEFLGTGFEVLPGQDVGPVLKGLPDNWAETPRENHKYGYSGDPNSIHANP